MVVDVCQGFVERKKKKEHMGPENVTSKVQANPRPRPRTHTHTRAPSPLWPFISHTMRCSVVLTPATSYLLVLALLTAACLQLFVRGPRDNMEQLYVKFREKHMLIRAKAFVEKTRRVSYVPRHGCRRRRGGRRMEKKRAYE